VPQDSKIKSINDVTNKRIVVQRGDVGHDYVFENKLSDNLIIKESPQEVLEALAAGEADCAILARLQGVIILKDKKIKHIKIVGSPIIQRKYCMAVTKGDSNLLAKLNEGLNIIKTSGEYNKICVNGSITAIIDYSYCVLVELVSKKTGGIAYRKFTHNAKFYRRCCDCNRYAWLGYSYESYC
jgi:ABC-type amino acid transport substrate-binding protein